MGSIRPGSRMRLLQEDVQLRRRKQDVLLDLPPKTVVRVPLALTSDQRRAYAHVEQAGRARLEDLGGQATVLNVLQLITRLKQICTFCRTAAAPPSCWIWRRGWKRCAPRAIAPWCFPSGWIPRAAPAGWLTSWRASAPSSTREA